MMAARHDVGGGTSCALRWRQRHLSAAWWHEQQSTTVAVEAVAHHSAARPGQCGRAAGPERTRGFLGSQFKEAVVQASQPFLQERLHERVMEQIVGFPESMVMVQIIFPKTPF